MAGFALGISSVLKPEHRGRGAAVTGNIPNWILGLKLPTSTSPSNPLPLRMGRKGCHSHNQITKKKIDFKLMKGKLA